MTFTFSDETNESRGDEQARRYVQEMMLMYKYR
jgi:hypothetical protein